MRYQKLLARGQLFASALLFGLMAALVRLGSLGAGAFTGPQLALVRMAIGAAMTLALFRLRPGTWRPVNHRLLVIRGLLGGSAVLLYFLALTRIPAGEATLLNNTFPVLATVISFWTLEERPTVHLGIALLLATLGMVLVLGDGSLPTALGWGEVLGLASAVIGAGAVTSIRALRATDNAFTIFFFFTLGGMAVSLPFAATAGSWPALGPTWLVAGAVGVLSFFAQVLMTHAYGALTVPEAAVWQQLTPLASYGWALLLLGERVSPAGMLGVLLGIGGVAYGTALGHRARARPAPAPVDDAARSLQP
jgi:drug/metabolite transporter (DMT)-like permease